MCKLQNNTFQGLVITNGFQSYAMFTYRCGELGWSGNATIGYKGTGSFYQNHDLSRQNTRLVACINSTSSSSWTNLVYSLSKYLKYSIFQSCGHDVTLYSTPAPKYLEFFSLGVRTGISRIFFPSVINRLSDTIFIPGGFKFGQTNHTQVYVRIILL